MVARCSDEIKSQLFFFHMDGSHSFHVTCFANSKTYFPGDFVYCVINAKCLKKVPFFWISAQIHGLCRESNDNNDNDVQLVQGGPASLLGFSKQFKEVLQCPATILGCEVEPEEGKTFECECCCCVFLRFFFFFF